MLLLESCSFDLNGGKWRNPDACGVPEEIISEEAILVVLDRMSLQFDDSVTCKGADSLYAGKRFEWLELEEQIGQHMPARQQAIHQGPVGAVQPALLARVKTEVPAYERAGREESTGKHVRAEMHVMVPIDASRLSAIEAAEFRDLSRHDILE